MLSIQKSQKELDWISHICDIFVMSPKNKKTKDAITILHKRYVKGNPARLAAIAEKKQKIQIAEQICHLRKKAKLTQKDLAEMIGTTQSVISRLENTDYNCERIDTLQKLAAALHCRLEVTFVPEPNSLCA